MQRDRIVLAMTGASGAIYGLRLCSELLKNGKQVALLVSSAGFHLLREEAGLELSGNAAQIQATLRALFHAKDDQLTYYADDDFMAPVASGSSAAAAMVVCPCTMGTVARLANGHSNSLIERCADVMLKEKLPLVLVPRETPLSEIHLENMLKLARVGARIIPAMPAFYHKPSSIDDLVNFIVSKVLDALGIDNDLYRRWGSPAEP